MDDTMQLYELQEASGFTRREILVVGGAAAAAFAAAGAVPRAARAAAEVKPLKSATWALNGDIVALDYTKAYDFNTAPVLAQVTESLLRFAPNGQLIPNLAERWSQPNALTYVYHIRRGVKFHDGSELTADDVAFSLNRHLDPNVGSYLATFFESVKSVKATGRYEVTVKLKRPDALRQWAVANMAGAVSSKRFLLKAGKKVGTPAAGIIGTGPFRFVSWNRGQSIALEAFPGYWNKARRAKIQQLTFRIIEDEATLVQALGTGEVDGAFNMSGRATQEVERLGQVKLYKVSSYGINYMAINTQRKPFNDRRVRQALSMAIDKKGLLNSTWGGQGQLVKSPVVPSMWTYAKPTFERGYRSLPAFDLDIAKAKALVEQAGAKGASARILVALPYEEQAALAVQAAAKQIGLNLQPQKITASDKIAREFSGKRTRDYDLTITEWGADFPDPASNLQVPFLASNGVTNLSAYHNPKVDRLLLSQRTLPNGNRRAQLLVEAQKAIVADQPWIVFYSPYTTMALNERLGGYTMRAMYYWDSWAADLGGA